MKRNKISVIGAGQVGMITAQKILERDLGDVILIDIVEGIPQGKALDLAESAWVEKYEATITGSNDYSSIEGSDIVVMTAGFPRKPGMSREDLLKTNAKIVEDAVKEIVKNAPNSIIIMVTNPLDIMTYFAHKISNFGDKRVMGMAGILDSSRFCYFIADALKVSVKDVQAMVLGGHGDSMVPLPRHSTVSGIPLPDLISNDQIEKLATRTRKAGTEIVNLLKTGSAFFSPGISGSLMVESILRDQKRVLPACVKLNGQYGLKDVFVGVAVKIGIGGAEEIVELKLSSDELSLLTKSAETVRKGMAELDQLLSTAKA